MKKIIKLIALTVFIFNFSSCYYDEIFEAEIPEGTVVSFDADIVPIFSQYSCTSCHNGNQDPNLTSGNEYTSLVPDYVEAGNSSGSEFYTKLEGGHANVDATSLQLIELWINQGADNN